MCGVSPLLALRWRESLPKIGGGPIEGVSDWSALLVASRAGLREIGGLSRRHGNCSSSRGFACFSAARSSRTPLPVKCTIYPAPTRNPWAYTEYLRRVLVF